MSRLNRGPLASHGVFFIAVLLGCGGNDDGGTPPPTTAIAKTSTGSGDAQSGTVGQPLANPLRVVVTEAGAPLSGTTVTWSTAVAGGEVDPSAVTDAAGVASTTWTLGTVSGSQTTLATVPGASGSPVTFTATAAAGPATTLAKADPSGDGQTAELGVALELPVQARVSDEHGNAVAGTAVGWEAAGGTVSSATVPTAASGISAVTVTAGGAAGPIIITAIADGLTGSPLTFTATAVEPVPIPATASVTVGNNFFRSNRNSTQNAAVDTVQVGGTVTWSWVPAAIVHSVDSQGSPAFTDSPLQTGPNYEFTFSTAGTYEYTCAAHPGQMTGRIVVR